MTEPLAPTPNMSYSPYLSPDQIATHLNVSKMTVYRLIHTGELPSIRVGRSYRVHVNDFTKFTGVGKVES